MFYRMVEKASRRWYGNPDCPATPIVSYIEAKGSLRDAQIEAIKTYGKKTDSFWNGTLGCKEKPKRLKIRNICGDESVFIIG